MPFVTQLDQKPMRIIDQEREAVVYRAGGTGGSSENLEVFELHWRNQKTVCIVEPKILNKDEVIYSIRQLTIPDSLKESQDEIVQLISDALDAYGYGWRRDFVSKLSVILSPKFVVLSI